MALPVFPKSDAFEIGPVTINDNDPLPVTTTGCYLYVPPVVDDTLKRLVQNFIAGDNASLHPLIDRTMELGRDDIINLLRLCLKEIGVV
jgi:hypothetical protein